MRDAQMYACGSLYSGLRILLDKFAIHGWQCVLADIQKMGEHNS